MKKILNGLLLSGLIVFFMFQHVFAATTVLPYTSELESRSEEDCIAVIKAVENISEVEEMIKKGNEDSINFFFGCAIKSGYIKFWMIPYFIKYILEYLIGIAGLLSVLMIIVGAYYYIWGGVVEDKEKGKKVIIYAVGGLIVTSLSWILVNIILLAITG